MGLSKPRMVDGEVCGFLRDRLSEMEATPWEDLEQYGQRTESFRACTGVTYTVITIARSAGGVGRRATRIEVWAYPEKGWRRWAPYYQSSLRARPDDPGSAPDS